MNALERYQGLLLQCEQFGQDEAAALIYQIATTRFAEEPHRLGEIGTLLHASADLEASTRLLVAPAIWRKYTDDSATVYGASPYNAKAQKPYTGFNRYTPLAIAAACLRMWIEPLAKVGAQ